MPTVGRFCRNEATNRTSRWVLSASVVALPVAFAAAATISGASLSMSGSGPRSAAVGGASGSPEATARSVPSGAVARRMTTSSSRTAWPAPRSAGDPRSKPDTRRRSVSMVRASSMRRAGCGTTAAVSSSSPLPRPGRPGASARSRVSFTTSSPVGLSSRTVSPSSVTQEVDSMPEKRLARRNTGIGRPAAVTTSRVSTVTSIFWLRKVAGSKTSNA